MLLVGSRTTHDLYADTEQENSCDGKYRRCYPTNEMEFVFQRRRGVLLPAQEFDNLVFGNCSLP